MLKTVGLLAVVVVIVSVLPLASAVQGETLEGVSVPHSVASLVGDQRINVYVTESPSTWDDEPAGSTRVLGVVLNGTMVSDVERSALDDATYEFIVGQQVVRDAENAENPREAVVNAYEEDKIRYRGVGTWNTVVTTTTNTMVSAGQQAYDGFQSGLSWFS